MDILKKTILFVVVMASTAAIATSCATNGAKDKVTPPGNLDQQAETQESTPKAEEDKIEDIQDPRTAVPGGIVSESTDGELSLPDGTVLQPLGSGKTTFPTYVASDGKVYCLISTIITDGQPQHVFLPEDEAETFASEYKLNNEE